MAGAVDWQSATTATTLTPLLDVAASAERSANIESTAINRVDLSRGIARKRRPAKRLTLGLELFLHTLDKQKRQRQEREIILQRSKSYNNLAHSSQPTDSEHTLPPWHLPHRQVEVSSRQRTASEMPGGVRLSGGPVLTDNETSTFESDISSVVDISDHHAASDSDDLYRDTNKFRMPDGGKTRLGLHTKEEFSPTPRVGFQRRRSVTPTRGRMGSAEMVTNSGLPSMEGGTSLQSVTSGAENDSGDGGDSTRPALSRNNSRAGSIYTLGRVSFTGQLAQLTSMRLPDAASLAKRISSMSTSTEAAQALSDASEQIRMWISKASDVLEGLNAEDDVEWAAAGGREGIEDVDGAINRFQQLVEVYILSIERLHTRPDVGLLTMEEVKTSEANLETIIASWKKIKDTLKDIKFRVEVAMEWEELWNTVLGEVSQEMNDLNKLVFEMEEKRHQGAESLLSSKDSIDLSELETIVEDQPGRRRRANNRFSVAMPFSMGTTTLPSVPPPSNDTKEDSSLLALFARMQPLRASLDFLPMRLATWHVRGSAIFPGACLDLDQRREQLEAQWGKLEADAESLRRELGEDRWVLVFRNAGRQAMKMCESITRSFQKLQESVGDNNSTIDLAEKVENYEAKKRHYGPAVERVLAIIDRGVSDRLTVNGEILRLQSDIKTRWAELQVEMSAVDALVDDLNLEARASQLNLRDSVSTVVSSEQRSVGSLADANTPASSPASSVIVTGRKDTSPSGAAPLTSIKTRSSSGARPESRLNSGRATGSSTASTIPRRSLLPRKSHFDLTSHPTPPPRSSIGTPNRSTSSMASRTPSRALQWPSRPEPTPQAASKGRFVTAVKAEVKDFRPLSAFEPSPYAKAPVTPRRYHRVSNAIGSPLGDIMGGQRSSTPTAPRIVSAPEKTTSGIPTPVSAARVTGTGSAIPSASTGYRSPAPRASMPALTSSSSTITPGGASRLRHKPSLSALRPSSRLANYSVDGTAKEVNGHASSSYTSLNGRAADGAATTQTHGSLKPTRNFLYPRAVSRLADSPRGAPGGEHGQDGDDADGNEADNESPTHHHRMRPPSRLAGGRLSALGARSSSALGGRARNSSRLEMRGYGQQGGEEGGGGEGEGMRPKWRP